MAIPLIDISPLLQAGGSKKEVAVQIATACREHGFFYIEGHGVDQGLQRELEDLSWQFFNQDLASKMSIDMTRGGRAWRGYFTVGSELTSGKPDIKEGLYFGSELGPEHPMVRAKIPLHGPNLFPQLPGFDRLVLRYMKELTSLGHKILAGIALSLELPEDYFAHRYLQDPLILFRIFHYPAPNPKQLQDSSWGVGEHTDYGVLTILKQDKAGGLQVKSGEKWLAAPFIENTFVCNLGDMLDRMTAGYYRSTPHRVNNTSGKGRLSFPLFFDPGFNSRIEPIDLSHLGHGSPSTFERWDGADLQAFSGTYGEYLLNKVSKVFPQLRKDFL